MLIREFIEDPNLFRGFFKNDLTTWWPWLVFFKVLGGEVLDEAEMSFYYECTGRTEVPPPDSLREVYVSAGRKSGKSTATAIIAAAYAIFGNWKQYLAPGETARVFIISPTLKQGEIIHKYLKAIFNLNNRLRKMVKRILADSIELENGVVLEIKSASWRSTRGFTVGVAIMEELAMWRYEAESANADREIFVALRPSMLTIKNSLTIGISTPFAPQGVLWEKFERHWGKAGPVLCWRAPTWRMNLSQSENEIREENAELDPNEFAGEFEARFRQNISGYLPYEIIDAAIVPGRQYLAPKIGIKYNGFADAAEGLSKGADNMTFACSHFEDGKYILDALLSFSPPFDPKYVVRVIVETCRQFKIYSIVQDRVSVGWIQSELKEYGISVEICQYDKSRIYELFAVLMNSHSVELLDDPRLRKQMLNLIRTVRQGGFTRIDAMRGTHEDEINSAAGSIVMCSQKPRYWSKAERLSRLPVRAGMKPPTEDDLEEAKPAVDMRDSEEIMRDFLGGKDRKGIGIPDKTKPDPIKKTYGPDNENY